MKIRRHGTWSWTIAVAVCSALLAGCWEDSLSSPDRTAPEITSTPVTEAVVGETYGYQVVATGNPSPTVSAQLQGGGALPAWLSFEGQALSGVPTAADVGQIIVVITATNGVSPNAVQTFSITVSAGPSAPLITSTPDLSVRVGELYSYQVTATGSPSPTLTATGEGGAALPGWLGFDGQELSGTPQEAHLGDHTVVITAANGISPDAEQTFTITVSLAQVAPEITSTPTTTATVGESWAYVITVTGYPTPNVSAALEGGAPLPSWLGLDGQVLVGTPDLGDVGTYEIVVTATNGVTPDAIQTFTLTVHGVPAAPEITSTPLTDATVGQAYSYAITATGSPTPTFTATLEGGDPLPDWLTLSGSVLSGTPGAADVGDYNIIVTATNSAGEDTQSYTLTVSLALTPPIFVSTPTTDATVGVPYEYTVLVDGYPPPTVVATGAGGSVLPAWLSFDGVVLSGTPSAGDVGEHIVVLTATNGVSPDAVQTIPILVVTPLLPGGTCDTAEDLTGASFPYTLEGDFQWDGAGGSCDSTATNAVFFTYTPATSDAYRIQALNATTTVAWSRLAVFEGASCDPYGQEVACQTANGKSISLDVDLLEGQTYLFVFYTDGDAFTMVDPVIDIGLVPPPPAGSTCDDAVDLTGATFPHTMSGDFQWDGAGGSCDSTATNAVFFTYTPVTSDAYRIQALNATTTSAYSRLAVFEGASCDPYDQEVACQTASGKSVSLDVDLLEGQTYLFVFYTDGNTYPMVDPVIDIGLVPPPPAGSTCDDPEDLTGATFPHTMSGDFQWDGAGGSCDSTATNAVFFTYTPTTTGLYGIQAQNATTTLAYSRLAVFEGTACDPYDQEVACQTANGKSVALELYLTEGQTYLFVFYTDGNNYSMVDPEITIALSATPDAPAITSTPVTSVAVGALYSYTVVATGNPMPTITATGPGGDPLPGWLVFDGQVLSGTPDTTDVGDYAIVITATNGVVPDAEQLFTITVLGTNQPPAITNPPTAPIAVHWNAPGSVQLEATDPEAPPQTLTWSVTGNDCGNFDPTIGAENGILAWTCAGVESCSVTVQVSDDFSPPGTDSAVVLLQCTNTAPVITSTATDTTAVHGIGYVYDVVCIDADGDTLALSLGSSHSCVGGALSDNGDGTGQYTYTPEAAHGATCMVDVRCGDTQAEAAQAFTLDLVECVTDDHCTSITGGACTGGACQAPSCEDNILNGDETDVDCGGSCPACQTGADCLDDADCVSGDCDVGNTNKCLPFIVVDTDPMDGEVEVSLDATVFVYFNAPVDPATLIFADVVGDCTDLTVQISADDFNTCVGLVAHDFVAGDNEVALVPVLAWLPGTIYKIRITAEVASAGGEQLAAAHETATGFTTEDPQHKCPGKVVISQVYGGGGNTGAYWTHDFVELHNSGPVPVSVDGWSMQYASATGTNWQVTNLSGTIPAGGYYLIQQAAGAGGTAPLPAPDATGSIGMGATAGKVALRSSTTGLTGACPLGDPTVVDFVGFGGTANCFEGTGPTPNLSATTAALRKEGGCQDTDDNAADFLVINPPIPRNSSSPIYACDCPMNETGHALEADYCILQFPHDLTVALGEYTQLIYGRIYELGVTEAAGASAQILAQVGYGPEFVDPAVQSGWRWFDATFNDQYGSDDEYQGSFLSPELAGIYWYTYRFSLDAGATWTYCDSDGAGSNVGLTYDPLLLGEMTVQ